MAQNIHVNCDPIIRQEQAEETSSSDSGASTSTSVQTQEDVYCTALRRPFLKWRVDKLAELVPFREEPLPEELAKDTH